MNWRGKTIVDLSRAFLDTNGAHQETDVYVANSGAKKAMFWSIQKKFLIKWLNTLSDLNECSQKGLVEMFDGSIGAGSYFMPYGGKYQLTETQAMVANFGIKRKDRNRYHDELWLLPISVQWLAPWRRLCSDRIGGKNRGSRWRLQ